MIIQMAGHPGSGKSTLARRLRDERGAIVLDLDSVKSPLLGAGVPWEVASGASYEVLWSVLDDVARPGLNVVVDTPSYWSQIHQRLTRVADDRALPYRFVECEAPSAVRAVRVSARSHRASQMPAAGAAPVGAPADWAEVDRRPIVRPDGRLCVVVDTTEPIDLDVVLGIEGVS